jgi:tRNA nucleotidyltransferase (CCA-adding enzyme)
VGAEIASRALSRLRYPVRLRSEVCRIVLHHAFRPPERPDSVRARQFLAKHGVQSAFDLVAHKEADLRAKGRDVEEDVAPLREFRDQLEAQRGSPHRLRDLAVRGDDLIELGYAPGPSLGAALERLLDEVVRDLARNTREWLTVRAKELM